MRNTRTNRFPSAAIRQMPAPRQPFWATNSAMSTRSTEVHRPTVTAGATPPHGAYSRADARVRDCGWSSIPAGNQLAHLMHDHRYQSFI